VACSCGLVVLKVDFFPTSFALLRIAFFAFCLVGEMEIDHGIFEVPTGPESSEGRVQTALTHLLQKKPHTPEYMKILT
jgi:hypothetical protein